MGVKLPDMAAGTAPTAASIFESVESGVSKTYTAAQIAIGASAIPVVETVAALRALPKTGNPCAHITGYYAAHDGGGGMYRYDSTDTTSSDNGGTIIVADDGGRWKMVNPVVVSTRQFGVKADWNGTTGTDDTAAWQKALNWAQTATNAGTYGSNSPWLGASAALYHPTGTSKITDALTATKKFSLIGEGQPEYSAGSRLYQATANKCHIIISPDAAGCSFSIEGMVFTGGAVAGTGDAIWIKAPVSGPGCNSLRILNNFFGNIQRFAINDEQGDDHRIEGNTFDVGAGATQAAIVLGTNTTANKVSNSRIAGNNFFQMTVRALLIYNVDGLQLHGNRQYNDGTFTTVFFADALNTAPKLVKNLSIKSNDFKYVSTLLGIDSSAGVAAGITIVGNDGVLLGAGAGETQPCIKLQGFVTDFLFSGNKLSGHWGGQYLYDDTVGTVTGALIANRLVATGGTVRALACANTTGRIVDNDITGFAVQSVSETLGTTGNALAPGTVNAVNSQTVTRTINGALVGDIVEIRTGTAAWPLSTGIYVQGYVSAANTVSLKYTNPTAGNIAQAEHDLTITVRR